MTAPDPRLGEIEARLSKATPGPWTADTGTRGDCVVWGPNGRFLMNMQAEPHWLEYPGETRSVAFDVDKRDAEFIAGAREDVAYLLAELRKRDEGQFALEISAEGYPRNVGPFRTREDAEQWMEGRKLTGSWSVYPLRAAVAAATGGGELEPRPTGFPPRPLLKRRTAG